MPKKRNRDQLACVAEVWAKVDSLGSYLRWLRWRRDMSLREVESLSGVSHAEIFRIEASLREFRLESFIRLCHALQFPPGLVLDDVMTSNLGFYHRLILVDLNFLEYWKAFNCDSAQIKQAVATNLAACSAFAAILLACANPVRRATAMEYPTADLQRRFIAFSERLATQDDPLARAAVLAGLRESPISELKRQELLSDEYVKDQVDFYMLPKAQRRKPTMSWVSWTVARFPEMPDAASSKAALGVDIDFSHAKFTAVHHGKISLWERLKERLISATALEGRKGNLAALMGVSAGAVSQWLSGDTKPTAETTLRLLQWVEQEEAKQKSSGSVTSTARGEATRKRKASDHETLKSGPP